MCATFFPEATQTEIAVFKHVQTLWDLPCCDLTEYTGHQCAEYYKIHVAFFKDATWVAGC